MLLLLASELRDELPRVLGTGELRDALSNLARAHREGKHIVSGPATLLRQLGEAQELPEDVRGTFQQLKRRHFDDADGLRKRASHVVVIELRDGVIEEAEGGNEARRCFRVPLEYFSDSGRVQASRLVAEDADDARVYQRAAEAYLCRLGPKGLSVHLQSYGGGGDSTADALRDHARHGPTVCVVDADYKWSDEEGKPAEGATAANARKAVRKLTGNTVCTVHAVPCREVENLLPPALVRECFVPTDRGDFYKRCVRAFELGLFGGGAHVNRLDLKKGLSRKDYESIPSGRPQRRYLTRFFEEHQEHSPEPERGWCGDEPRCGGKKTCECVIFEGIGSGLLAQIAKRLETLTLEEVAEHLLASGQPCAPAWTAIGSLLFAWGCAYPRTRT
jgi:hypothetical protein